LLRLQEVEALVKCHEDHPYMKFLNACGQHKADLDTCFRVRQPDRGLQSPHTNRPLISLHLTHPSRLQEEKKLRKKLNKRVDPLMPSAIAYTHPIGGESNSNSSSSTSGSSSSAETAKR
jgi:hypothetical protein